MHIDRGERRLSLFGIQIYVSDIMGRRAFMKRDYFTCSECYFFCGETCNPRCKKFGKVKYDPNKYGCGDFAKRD